MTELTIKQAENGSFTAGPIEGAEWSNITEESRFWPMIAARVEAGEFTPFTPPPAPSPYQPIKPYQFWTAVRATGHEQELKDWVAALENPLERAAASSMLEFSLEYRFDHPFMGAARDALGLSLAEFETMWLWAMTL